MSILDKIEKRIRNKGLYSIYKLSKYSDQTIDSCINDQKKAFLMMSPTYGNVGDQAIAYYTTKFILKNFPDYKLVIVSEESTYRCISKLKTVCNNSDLIFLQGGGNMGNIYPHIEKLRQFCIREFPDNIIISMPTTIRYTSDSHGKKALIKSKKIYNSHPNLILYAREKYSYEYMKKEYPDAFVKLVPDIVLIMNRLRTRVTKKKESS